MTSHSHSGSLSLACAALLLCFLLFGCGDTCFVITGIFPNASSTTNPPSCQLPTSGTITIGVSSVADSSVAPMVPNLRHIFVTIRGVEANPDALAAEDSPAWQELAPELASEPVQIDLMATSVSDTSCSSRLARKAAVRADVYRQVRLRLVPDQPDAGAPQSPHNECAGMGFNCVVDTNGVAHPLALKSGASDILISPDRIAGGSFNVLAESETHLSIVFDPYSSLAVAAGDAVQINPVFSAEVRASCNSSSSSP